MKGFFTVQWLRDGSITIGVQRIFLDWYNTCLVEQYDHDRLAGIYPLEYIRCEQNIRIANRTFHFILACAQLVVILELYFKQRFYVFSREALCIPNC